MKPFFKSKTLFANALLVAAALYPPTAALITAEPTTTVVVAALLNLLLRAMTRDKVVLFPEDETAAKQG